MSFYFHIHISIWYDSRLLFPNDLSYIHTVNMLRRVLLNVYIFVFNDSVFDHKALDSSKGTFVTKNLERICLLLWQWKQLNANDMGMLQSLGILIDKGRLVSVNFFFIAFLHAKVCKKNM